MRDVVRAVILGVLAVGSVAFAQDSEPVPAEPAQVARPAPEAVKSTWDFFYKGKGGGVVLADAKVCLEVGKEGETKGECTKDLPAEGVKEKTSVLVWQAYIIPQGDTIEDLMVQLKQGDVVRETKDVKVKGESIRTRTWSSVRLPKAGSWTISVIRGSETLKTFTVNAIK
jgi:hypothetical protein